MTDFAALRARLPEIQAALDEHGLDGWLLYDLHARNAVAAGLLGVGDLTRRYFVLIPRDGEPVAVTHAIEQGPWEAWPWRKLRYVGWRQLEQLLAVVLAKRRRLALEAVERDAVPAVDLVPWGVVELIRAAGPEIVPSADLVTRFYARWSAAQLASHRRVARVLADVARAAFDRLAAQVKQGGEANEGELRAWLLGELERRGCGVGADSIVASGVNAANPHYHPQDAGAPLRQGDLVLIDLWSKEAEEMVYADQTWMAVLDARVPERVEPLWAAIRDGRDAAVRFLTERWGGGPVRGYEVDDVARGLIAERGYADRFIHRTGHSIDRDTHGAGPNIDNLETHEVRTLIPGIGFSIEPGIYIPGEVGVRTEINVYLAETGPEVTTPEPQERIFTLLPED